MFGDGKFFTHFIKQKWKFLEAQKVYVVGGKLIKNIRREYMLTPYNIYQQWKFLRDNLYH